MKLIGKLTSNELETLRALYAQIEFDDVVDDGFVHDLIGTHDKEDAAYFGITSKKLSTIIKQNDYTRFYNLHIIIQSDEKLVGEIVKLLLEVYNKFLTNKTGTTFAYRGYYAMEHTDTHFDTNMQMMLVLSNGGHRIVSREDENPTEILAPNAGDIVTLNTYERHALMPNASMSARRMAQNPLEFFSVPYLDTNKAVA